MKHQNFHHVYQLPKVKLLKGETKSQIDQKVVDAAKAAIADLMKIEVKLNEKFHWWESPTVCRWEPWEESQEFSLLDFETKNYNLHFEEHVKEESEKLFSVVDPQHYKKIIEMKDFDLNSPPENVKLADLVKNYLVPSMPEEFKFFHEQLEIFKQKQKEWKTILSLKKELNDADNDTSIDMKEFLEPSTKIDNGNITIKEFHRLFREKTFQPRNLFPIKYRNLIKVLECSEVVHEAQRSRKRFKENSVRKSASKVNIGEDEPLKNEPLLISEFLQQIENVKQSLQPFFSEIEMIHGHEPSISFGSEINEKQEKIKSRNKPKTGVRYSQITELKMLKSDDSEFSSDKKTLTRKKKSSSKKNDDVKSIEVESKTPISLIKHHQGKWSTKDIYEQSYDIESRTVTFYAERLGTFGFSTKKYSNLPLKKWEIFPLTDHINGSHIVLILEAKFVTVEFKITNDGYTFKITNNTRKSPPEETKNPVKVFDLKNILTSMNLNLFPEIDAGCYVENICEKHKPMELHTYKSMAVYCLSHHFKSSVWNRFSHRRVAVFESRMILKKISKTLMVTPLRAVSVNVREKCTELQITELDFEMNPSEQEVKSP